MKKFPLYKIFIYLCLFNFVYLGEWWKNDARDVYEEFLRTGGAPNDSDAITINGQPGDLYACKIRNIELNAHQGKTYLLRMVNAAMNLNLFFSVSKHHLTVVGVDSGYSKPLTRDYICIAPGQTADVLLHANQEPNDYYMAARAFNFFAVGYGFGNFDIHKDHKTYNLIDPPIMNTILVPKKGWASIKYRAANPEKEMPELEVESSNYVI
ncbi:hypothetical protein GLYMA_02G076300v4 [Glycine max]|uniref:laccase n=2 Tax=Glycine subgen. Soja TaxID=1462606 RepID=K7K6Z5_SOYBN|nr:hypothetical protein GYH30_003323 [Glycine max]KRH70220.1 hypothetical protein GLYMA_02G076300v4 [Glycine max]RZC23856.1 Laccase-15 [Glycine soja]